MDVIIFILDGLDLVLIRRCLHFDAMCFECGKVEVWGWVVEWVIFIIYDYIFEKFFGLLI